MLRLTFTCLLAAAFVLLASPLVGVPAQEVKLRSSGEVLGSDAPYSFPEKIVVGPRGNAYLLDTQLSNIFFLDMEGGKVGAVCPAGSLGLLSDMSIDPQGNIWVLDARSPKITKLNPQCVPETQFMASRVPLKIAVNSFGEVLVLTAEGEPLFDLYSRDGKLLRSFGKRFDYGNSTENAELSDGRIVPDRAGGFYFSFNYPPLVQHYTRTGTLASEFKPESDVAIEPPQVTARRQGPLVAVAAKYQIVVLDMASDGRGRLYLLISGKNKIQALTQGTPNLTVTTDAGRTLKKVSLENSFHRLAVGSNNLLLLRNREPLKLDEYPMP